MLLPPQLTAAAPAKAAGNPAPECVTGAERQTGRDHAGGDISRPTEIIRRIGRIRPRPVYDSRIVVGHINCIGLRRLDDDDLPAALLLCRDGLLLGRAELVAGLGPRAQPLNRVHYVRLLRQHGVAQLLRPVELAAHHLEHRRRRGERLHAVIPLLLVHRRLEIRAGEVLVGLDPALGLDHLERIGRGHEDFGKQGVGIERDRRHQRVELLRLEQLVGLRGRRLRLRDRRVRHRQQKRRRKRPYRHPDHLDLPFLANLVAAERLRSMELPFDRAAYSEVTQCINSRLASGAARA